MSCNSSQCSNFPDCPIKVFGTFVFLNQWTVKVHMSYLVNITSLSLYKHLPFLFSDFSIIMLLLLLLNKLGQPFSTDVRSVEFSSLDLASGIPGWCLTCFPFLCISFQLVVRSRVLIRFQCDFCGAGVFHGWKCVLPICLAPGDTLPGSFYFGHVKPVRVLRPDPSFTMLPVNHWINGFSNADSFLMLCFDHLVTSDLSCSLTKANFCPEIRMCVTAQQEEEGVFVSVSSESGD